MKFNYDHVLNACEIQNTENGFRLKANEKSDFICKWKEYIKDDASFFYTEKTGDFTFKAEIETNGNYNYDAVFLMARSSKTKWIKLALELGVDKSYNAVSVITDEWSDDANGELIPSNKCWLRLTRKENFWGLHYSLDGKKWRFVRCFGLELSPTVAVGFGIQSPVGNNCSGTVSHLDISNEAVANFRNGS